MKAAAALQTASCPNQKRSHASIEAMSVFCLILSAAGRMGTDQRDTTQKRQQGTAERAFAHRQKHKKNWYTPGTRATSHAVAGLSLRKLHYGVPQISIWQACKRACADGSVLCCNFGTAQQPHLYMRPRTCAWPHEPQHPFGNPRLAQPPTPSNSYPRAGAGPHGERPLTCHDFGDPLRN